MEAATRLPAAAVAHVYLRLLLPTHAKPSADLTCRSAVRPQGHSYSCARPPASSLPFTDGCHLFKNMYVSMCVSYMSLTCDTRVYHTHRSYTYVGITHRTHISPPCCHTNECAWVEHVCASPWRKPSCPPSVSRSEDFATLLHLFPQGTGTSVAPWWKKRPCGGWRAAAASERRGGLWRVDAGFVQCLNMSLHQEARADCC